MKRLIYLILAMVATMSLPSCKHSTVFDSYAHTPIAGWENTNDKSQLRRGLHNVYFCTVSLSLRSIGLNAII